MAVAWPRQRSYDALVTIARPLLVCLVLCAACAEFPELDRAVTPEGRAAPAPELAPIDPTLGPAAAAQAETERLREVGEELRARAAGTRARSDSVASAEGVSEADRAAALARRAALIRQREAAASD